MKRIIALFLLFAILVLIIMLLYFSFTGGEPQYILAVLFCLMVLPGILYIYSWFIKIIRKDRD